MYELFLILEVLKWQHRSGSAESQWWFNDLFP